MARILKDYSEVSLKCADLKGALDFVRIFGRSAPVHLDIGCGKGTFLVNQARAQPDIDFLGIEWARKYYRYAVDRIGRWKLSNVRITRTDAETFLSEHLADSSVDCFHIYFPDPWPKKRHHKRRFFNTANAQHLLRILKTGGTVRIATDHADYFEQIQKVLADYESQLERIEFLPAMGAEQNEWVGTNFERKYIKEKRQIYTIAFRNK